MFKIISTNGLQNSPVHVIHLYAGPESTGKTYELDHSAKYQWEIHVGLLALTLKKGAMKVSLLDLNNQHL